MSDDLDSGDISSWVEECLRLRYGKHHKAGVVLARLIEITRTMKSNPPQGGAEFSILAEYVGAIILKQALSVCLGQPSTLAKSCAFVWRQAGRAASTE